MNRHYVTLVIIVVSSTHRTVSPAESFLTKLMSQKLKTYFFLSDSKREEPFEDPDRSIHMKATKFVMKTIANQDVENILAAIKDNEKKMATNFFEEAQKLQALLVQEGYPTIVRKKSLSALYRGSAFSTMVAREQDALHVHTEITTTHPVRYRLEDDSHTKAHTVYVQVEGGWESISSCQTYISWENALNRVKQVIRQQK